MLFDRRKRYNFATYAPTILGDSYNNMEVMSIMGLDDAMKEDNIFQLHAQVFPHLPDGTPNVPNQYDYIKFRTSAGNTVILAYTWVVENSIQEVTSTTLRVTIFNADISDMAVIRDLLNGVGVTYTIEEIAV